MRHFLASMTISPRPSVVPAVIALIALSVLWGYTWVLAKVALVYSDPFDFAAWRIAIGALCLMGVLAWQGKLSRPARVKETAFYGLTQTAGCFLLSIWALAEGGAGKTAVLVYIMPFWVVLLGWPILGERVRGGQWWAVGLGFAGLMFILEPWGLRTTLFSKILGTLAGLSWAVSSVHVKRMQRKGPLDVMVVTFWQLVFGLLPMAAVALLASSRPTQWTATFVVALLYNGVLSTAVGAMLWLYILKRLPAWIAGMSSLAVPAVAILTAWLQLGEMPSAAELLGMILVSVALAILSLRGIRRRRRWVTSTAASPAIGR